MIGVLVIGVVVGYVFGRITTGRRLRRTNRVINYNSELRKVAVDACVTWAVANKRAVANARGTQDGWYDATQSNANKTMAMLRLANYLGLDVDKVN